MSSFVVGDGSTRHALTRRKARAPVRVRCRQSCGFSVVEILAALTLFAAMFVAFASLSTSTVAANHEARRITAAANLARDKIEELRARSYATVVTGSDSLPLKENGQSGGAGAIYTRSWTVVTGPTAATKEVTVTVQWTDETTHQIQLKTLIGS